MAPLDHVPQVKTSVPNASAGSSRIHQALRPCPGTLGLKVNSAWRQFS